jgi:hypothetical protein
MTKEEVIINMAETMKAAEKLEPARKKEFDEILELLDNGSKLILEQKDTLALVTSIFPLIVMLTFKYLQQFVAEHISQADAMDLLLTSLFESKKKDLNNEN